MFVSVLARAIARARRSKFLASSVLIVAPLLGENAIAQTPPVAQQTAGPTQLGTIDVTSATGVATPESQIASSVTVITAADIERDQRRTVPDVLATVPGLNVVQTGGPGGLTSVFMRGTNSNHVKVLVDGIDVSDPGVWTLRSTSLS